MFFWKWFISKFFRERLLPGRWLNVGRRQNQAFEHGLLADCDQFQMRKKTDDIAMRASMML